MKKMRARFSWLTLQDRCVQCTAEDDFSEEEYVVAEVWLQEEVEPNDGMQQIRRQLLRCKFLARLKRIRNVKGNVKFESGSNSKEAVRITTDLIRSNRGSLLLR